MAGNSTKLTRAMVRKAAKAFGAKGTEFGYALFYELYGYEVDGDRAVVRSHITSMVDAGELRRVKNGVFVYNFNYRPRGDSPLRIKMWRFIRSQKPGWTLQDMALMSGASYTHVARYCDWLEQEGYIAAFGKEGNTITYKATAMATKAPEMPQPPTEERNPFETECRAAGVITNRMLYGNLYSLKTKREIVAACNVLLARFDETCNQNENGEHHA